jgi:hypothetical protein
MRVAAPGGGWVASAGLVGLGAGDGGCLLTGLGLAGLSAGEASH